MSKRAQKVGLKAYPIDSKVRFSVEDMRMACQEGYEIGEKEAVQKIAKLLLNPEALSKIRLMVDDSEVLEMLNKAVEE